MSIRKQGLDKHFLQEVATATLAFPSLYLPHQHKGLFATSIISIDASYVCVGEELGCDLSSHTDKCYLDYECF